MAEAAPREAPLLAACEVSIRFGGLQALDRVTLAVGDGEIVGLIGPNGAGKTTLFDCVTGFTTPDGGRIEYRGEDVTGTRPDQRARLGIGRTFQQVGLVRSFTVLENVLAAQHGKIGYDPGGGMFGSPPSWAEERLVRDRAFEVLDYLGLAHLAHARLDGLPYGTLKQVEVAATLGTDPDVLMLDEPLAGLAPEEGDAFGDRLAEMREELGLTVVVIEHHVPFVLRICDYVYVLNFGRLLAQGEPSGIREDAAVAEAYMGAGAVALG